MKWKWLTQWAVEIAASVRSDASALACCGAATRATMSGFTPFNKRPGRAGAKLPAAGYLSMNTDAWQPSPTAAGPQEASLNCKTNASEAGMIRHGRFRECPKAAPGARFRGKQHGPAGGGHGAGAARAPRCGLG